MSKFSALLWDIVLHIYVSLLVPTYVWTGMSGLRWPKFVSENRLCPTSSTHTLGQTMCATPWWAWASPVITHTKHTVWFTTYGQTPFSLAEDTVKLNIWLCSDTENKKLHKERRTEKTCWWEQKNIWTLDAGFSDLETCGFTVLSLSLQCKVGAQLLESELKSNLQDLNFVFFFFLLKVGTGS